MNVQLYDAVKNLYLSNGEILLFHGWHHIKFVTQKSLEFAEALSADQNIVYSSALVHDLNYLVSPNSEPDVATSYRENLLSQHGHTPEEVKRIENIILEAHTGNRSKHISGEAKALSDADTLFKSLPITPILLTGKYLLENKVNIRLLAKKIIQEQNPLMEDGIYFYTELAKTKYLKWAKTNLELWNNVYECLDDIAVFELLEQIEGM